MSDYAMVLAVGLAKAVLKDEAPEVGGFDLSAGMLGPNVSEWIRSLAAPIEMILFCPSCHTQHIDAPDERTPGWLNQPHRSHLCHTCGFVWRPADVLTVGVANIKTRGQADSLTPGGQPILSHAGALGAIEQFVRRIEILCDAHGFDPVQWLAPSDE